jgi:hypothetical protein
LPVVIAVPPMQSISGNNDGTYTMYVLRDDPCPWFGMSAMFRAMAAEVREY